VKPAKAGALRKARAIKPVAAAKVFNFDTGVLQMTFVVQ
jgi:hypothetical protein